MLSSCHACPRTDARTDARTECEDRARILKQNSQLPKAQQIQGIESIT